MADCSRLAPCRTARAALTLILLFALGACSATAPVTEVPAPSRSPELTLRHALIPRPASADLSGSEEFVLGRDMRIVVDPGDEEAIRIGVMLASLIGNTVDTTPEVVESDAVNAGDVRLTRRGAPENLGQEGYDLRITNSSVTLSAAGAAGLFYGVQTIRQLLPWYVEYSAASAQPLWLPVGQVVDSPRFFWRGSMLDVARHFLAPRDVKRYIDLMALFKLNRLHIHLSDDQGWRIEIPGRPRLTEIGATSQVGGKRGGFYTTEEYIDLVRYAEDRFITIVPEIDMPGHTNAALVSYAELNCDGVARDPFIGTEVGFSSLCVEKEETYAFIDEVVREIAAMTPGPFFHIGGDEVHELTPEQYVRFMERAQDIVVAHGKRVVGWDEIAEAALDLVPGTIIQVWRPQTPATGAAVAEAVARGASVILSPADRVYIDMKYDTSTVLGLAWAGYNDVRDAYDWEPAALVPGLPEEAILGVEAPLWSETVESMADFEYMAFPRLAGVAELGWSSGPRSWEEYRLRLGAQAPRWTALGINFFRAPEVPWR